MKFRSAWAETKLHFYEDIYQVLLRVHLNLHRKVEFKVSIMWANFTFLFRFYHPSKMHYVCCLH